MVSKGGARLPLDVYGLISSRAERHGADVFALPVPLAGPVICMRGEEAARLFYDEERFERAGVLPRRVQATLVGEGGVQSLDGEAHRHRKAMFMGLMDEEAVVDLGAHFSDAWRRTTARWASSSAPVVLYDEVGRLLFEVGCTWAGIPVDPDQVAVRTDDMHGMIETPLAFGPRHRRGRRARRRAERWAGDLVDGVRRGRLSPPPDRALAVIARHRDLDGTLLDRRIAAVELLNVVRPTVAVDRFIVFVASALHAHHGWAERVRTAGDDDPVVEWFVDEVRRTAPFFPVQAARARSGFTWQGVDIPAGALVVLDFYGTDHHPALWPEPERFDPCRFAADRGAFALVPQGGGDHLSGHRCAGEAATVELMRRAARALTRDMTYDVPPQDLRVSRRKVPALPDSGFVITDVRLPGTAG